MAKLNESNEIWKDIIGYEGRYQVSNLGRVKGVDRYLSSPIRGAYLYKGRLLRPAETGRSNKKGGGYMSVCLRSGSGVKEKTLKVHRLVAQMFIPNPENKPQVNHIDGNKQNNCIDNLEWVTGKENINHAFKNNLFNTRIGTYNSNSKLSNEDVKAIVVLVRRGVPFKNIADIFKVTVTAISDINTGKRWKHII